MNRRIAAAVVAVTLIAGLAGCVPSSDKPSTAETSEVTGNEVYQDAASRTTDCPVPDLADESRNGPPAKTDPSGATADDLLAYLKSEERVARYQALASLAGPKLATTLQTHKFGTTLNYDAWQQPLSDGYVGWGRVAAVDEVNPEAGTSVPTRAFVEVWWNGDGTVDPARSAGDMGASNVSNVRGNQVSIFNPNTFVGEDTWSATRIVGCHLVTLRDIYVLADTEGWNALGLQASGIYIPATMEEVKQFDNEVLAQFEVNVASWLGAGWKE